MQKQSDLFPKVQPLQRRPAIFNPPSPSPTPPSPCKMHSYSTRCNDAPISLYPTQTKMQKNAKKCNAYFCICAADWKKNASYAQYSPPPFKIKKIKCNIWNLKFKKNASYAQYWAPFKMCTKDCTLCKVRWKAVNFRGIGLRSKMNCTFFESTISWEVQD